MPCSFNLKVQSAYDAACFLQRIVHTESENIKTSLRAKALLLSVHRVHTKLCSRNQRFTQQVAVNKAYGWVIIAYTHPNMH